MQLGFTLTGLLEGAARRKSGAQPGDALILTKAIGTGVIMAAEMQGAAAGEDVAAALAAMLHPQARAADVLAPHAHALTDITGFGLAGHLAEMLADGDIAAELLLEDIPVLPGACALVAAGHASALAQANRAAVAHLLQAPDTPRAALLCDPQTAGGLLAAGADALAGKNVG
jgi:selenide,water dikinase